jgi:hypothetical protein
MTRSLVQASVCLVLVSILLLLGLGSYVLMVGRLDSGVVRASTPAARFVVEAPTEFHDRGERIP